MWKSVVVQEKGSCHLKKFSRYLMFYATLGQKKQTQINSALYGVIMSLKNDGFVMILFYSWFGWWK